MKKLFITFYDVRNGKISPVNPCDNTPTVTYRDQGFVCEYDSFKKSAKDLPWDKIDLLLANGLQWQGNHYGSLDINIQLDK